MEQTSENMNWGIQELESLAHQAMAMGNDDGESTTIRRLAERVQKREITLEEAVTQARAIIEGKNEI